MPHNPCSIVIRATACGALAAIPFSLPAQADSVRGSDLLAHPSTSAAPVCWRGKPLPQCRSFWLTEISGEYSYATTKTHYRFDYGTTVNAYDRPDVSNRLLWTIGPMFNTSPFRAVGGTLSAGFVEEGSRLALEARRRWWTQAIQNRPTFDLSAGLVRLNLPVSSDNRRHEAYGITAGAYAIGGDLIQLNSHADVLLAGGRVRAGGTVGAGFGSYAAAGATVLVGALALLLIAAIAGEGDF